MDERNRESSADPPVHQKAFMWLDRHMSAGVRTDPNASDLLETVLDIFIRSHRGWLGVASPMDRHVSAQRLQAFQQPHSGLFCDPSSDLASHNSERSADQADPLTRVMTGLALQALKLLDVQPGIALHFAHDLKSAGALTSWLESLEWSNAALSAEDVMTVLLAFVHQVENEKDQSSQKMYHIALDWLESRQDPRTGLIGSAERNDLRSALLATDRLLPFFVYAHRPIQRTARIVDTILSLQSADDALARANGCGRESLAAVNVLTLLRRQSTYRRGDVTEILRRTYDGIVAAQRDDGTFSDEPPAATDTRLARHPMLAEGGTVTSTLFAVWLRVLTLRIIEHTTGDRLCSRSYWFQPWPGLGYHSSDASLSAHERDVLPLWIRPTAHSGASSAETTGTPPTVTVVIPCYNLGRYLHEAIESVLAQTFQDLEIVVVDDGSTDEYTDLLLQHLERPKTRIVRQANRGLAAARNEGIQSSSGGYISCLDADDRLRPDFLASAVEILDRDPEIGLVSGFYSEFDEGGLVVRSGARSIVDVLPLNPLIQAAVFRREAWTKVGGYYSGFSSSGIEDWDLWLNILERGYQLAVIPRTVLEYRIRSEQMSTKMFEKDIWGRLVGELVERHYETYRQHLVEVIVALAQRWRELRGWALECQRASAWWERQAVLWEAQANRGGETFLRQQAWIAELERVAAEREQKARDRIAQLERLDAERERQGQSQIAELQNLAVQREHEVRARFAELEQQIAALDARRLKRRIERLWAKSSERTDGRSK